MTRIAGRARLAAKAISDGHDKPAIMTCNEEIPMMRIFSRSGLLALVLVLGAGAAAADAVPLRSAAIDRRCDTAAYPSAAWTACEARNFAMIGQAAAEEAGSLAFLLRWQAQGLANTRSLAARDLADPSWLSPRSLNTPVTPLCTTWSLQCAGDPFRYAEAAGADGATFYRDEAEVVPVVFYDDGCARLSGRVWAPKGSKAGDHLPGIVIENGSVEAPETLYWWAAQALVRAGYVVMTSDPRGQGRSDLQTPTGGQGSNVNTSVFTTGLVNGIDFFRSSAARRYPHNLTCAGTYPTAVTAFNPFADRIDPNRLGIAGHSACAGGVLNVQAYGTVGADPWPGKLDARNPVKVAVAWDSPTNPNITTGGATALPGVSAALLAIGRVSLVPKAGVPVMEMQSEYGLAPTPFITRPDAESHKVDFRIWTAAGLPVFQFTIRGSTHYEFSLLPTFPATSWCPDAASGTCRGGWGNPMAQHYTLAWFDRWLKQPGESGYADADARLLDDSGEQGINKMSYHFRSARDFTDRAGVRQRCEDIRAGC